MLSSLPGHLDPGHLQGACQEAGRAMKVAAARLLGGTTLMVSVEQIIADADELPDSGCPPTSCPAWS